MKQPNGFSCFAACAAMAVGCDIQEVFDFCGHDGTIPCGQPDKYPARGFVMRDILPFLASKGYSIGVWLDYKLRQLAVPDVVVTNAPAILTVPSKKWSADKYSHAVYWDGAQIHDPSPDEPETTLLEEYEVLEWWPLIQFGDER